MYFRLPLASSSPPSRPHSSHNSRYPLSSPTTTAPSVCTQNSLATRRDSNSSTSDTKSARALLSRVASSPIVPKGINSHPSSPLSAHHDSHHHGVRNEQEAPLHPTSRGEAGLVGAMERRWSDGYEAARGWTGHTQREGYISFPDYEKYFPGEAAEAYHAGDVPAADAHARRREIQA